MTTATALEAERLADLGGLKEALNRAGLPVADLDRPGRVFFRFSSEGGTVGFAGLEGNAPDMLLRPVAVAPDNQNQGHGGRIVAALEQEAAALGATRLHLLTDTDARFFAVAAMSLQTGGTRPRRSWRASNSGRSARRAPAISSKGDRDEATDAFGPGSCTCPR